MKIFSEEQEREFEKIWLNEREIYYKATEHLTDDEYINYHTWEDINCEKMFKKYNPKVIMIRENNPNIIFGATCLGCLSQRLHGINRCKNCKGFRGDDSKPKLKIEGEGKATLSAEDFIKALTQNKDKDDN